MNRLAITQVNIAFMHKGRREAGFTLIELLITLAIIGIISAIAVPAMSSYYGECCLNSAAYEITGMIEEAKQSALSNEKYYAISFDTATGKISLLSGRGADGTWNTGDDEVIRSFRLADKNSGLRFSHGSYGPLDGLAQAPDGVSFPNNNTIICNPDLTGNAGVVYIMSSSGAAMAIKMNSTDYGYTLHKWNGKKWVKM